MIVSLICEPRSGSNNLVQWFRTHKTFDCLTLPSYEKSPDYQNGLTPKNYKFNNENLIIKEEFNTYYDFTELISISDFVIYLYRENFKEQIESWFNCNKTKNFSNQWVFEKNKISIPENEIINFKNLKRDFKEIYLNNNNNFKISYEDLYFNGGIEKIVTFLKNINLDTSNFPIGQKYRIDIESRNLI